MSALTNIALQQSAFVQQGNIYAMNQAAVGQGQLYSQLQNQAATYSTSAGSLANAGTVWQNIVVSGNSATSLGSYTVNYDTVDVGRWLQLVKGELKLPQNEALRIRMQDGSVIEVDDKGNFRVDDTAAKVVYKANRVREFNHYVNASDLLAEFIKDLGDLRVKRGELMELPVGLFINWLIIRAAEADGDPLPADVIPPKEHKLLKGRVSPRCLACHRFVRRITAAQGFAFCNPDCASRAYTRLRAA